MRAGKTPQRLFLEETLLPSFALRLEPGGLVVNAGAGDHPYREPFAAVRYVTADREPGCDETWPVESIPYRDGTVAGLLLLSVLDRLDDPMQAMREVRRVLAPGGWLLFGAAGLGFPWRKSADRWRLSPGGVAHVLQGFTVAERHDFGCVYHYAVARRTS